MFVVFVRCAFTERYPTDFCSLCYHTISHLDLLTVQNPGNPISNNLAQTACKGYTNESKQQCSVIIQKNLSTILALRSRGLSPLEICVHLTICPRPARSQEDFTSGFQYKRPPPKAGVLCKLRHKLAGLFIDAKQTSEKLLARAAKACKQLLDDGVDLVKSLLKSKEFKNLKKDTRQAVGEVVEQLQEADDE
jgi:hypothetical protein